ncbi:dynamin family protein [Actinomycetospora sp. CA-101289]|uniref:dynamin family protein n=1 Tax=Actinomycetospora sp. CA-101289 TaxID=3239893 RepID=UPI003D972469
MPAAATRRVAAACDEVLTRPVPGAVREGVLRVRRELERPLRLAVVGRVKAGKSTLVNALLGQRVARVDASECTRAVTWFSYGHQEKVVVHARNGRSWTRAFEADGYLPADLGAAPEDIASVEVVLCNEALAGTTVIDTPGLDSLTADAGARTEELLGLDGDSQRALQAADAVLFLVPQLTRSDDQRLRALAAAMSRTAGASGFSPATVLAVLSRADTIDDGTATATLDGSGDTWPAATVLAARYAEQLQGVAGGVVPVAGLLAEAADASLITDAVVDDLRRLAAMPEDDRELLLLSANLFASTPDVGVPEANRARLLGLLGLPGLRLCLAHLADGHEGAEAVSKRLRALSGIEAVHDAIRRLFTAQADAIGAHRALVALESLSFAPGAPAWMRDVVEEAREDPALQGLRERDVLVRWTRGELLLPPELAADLQALAHGADDATRLGGDPRDPAADREALGRRALAAATRWLRFANDPRTDLPARRAAEVVRDSYTAAWERLAGPA